jgi:dihydrofolate reductase
MRKINVFDNLSLDGYFTDAQSDMSWAHKHDEEWTAVSSSNAGGEAELLFGRVTYEMMEGAWRRTPTGWPEWMADWMIPFAETIDAAEKYVVSSTLDSVDWNAQLVRGDLAAAVRELKQQPGEGLATGGVTLPLALADLGLIDEYEFVVQPVVVGRGPSLLAGLRERLLLELVGRTELRSGAVALTYRPRP